MKRKSIIAFTMLFQASVAFGDVYIYPNKGQSAQQQDRDRYECHSWAVGQTGFDPTRPAQAPAPSSPQPGGEVVKGAARWSEQSAAQLRVTPAEARPRRPRWEGCWAV